ncbi:MaoC family dehydratase N-terminal domain-containing protein [Thermodesulfobacteriota bacterium]
MTDQDKEMKKEKDKKASLGDGKITEEGLAKLRSLIGVKLRISQQFNGLASMEAIRNFCNGMGDINPLYRDRDYAAKTRYGRLTAPPSWYYSVFPTWVSVGLPGVHGFHSGNDWTFYKPLFEGDTVTPECEFMGYDEKRSKFSGRLIMLNMEARYFNQNGDLLAKAGAWSARAERSAARKTGKYAQIELPHPWTDEELAKVEEEVLSEEIRGNEPRYWEDVNVGDELKPVVKGPFGLTDMIAYCVGAAPVNLLAHGAALSMYRRHPAWAFRDPATYALEPIYGVHYNKAAANSAGLPECYDVGTQRNAWLMHLLTNWMGDDGWLKRNYCEYRKFVYFSDVVWFNGKVTKKYEEDGDYCVDIDTHAMNQRGEDTAPGHSTVVLPSREKGVSPLDARLS